MKNFKIIGITALISIIATTVIVKLYWPNVEFKIQYVHTGPTTHTTDTSHADINKPEDCQVVKDCANSPIKAKAEIKENKVIGRAYDDCKYADFEIALKAQSTDRYIIQFGMGWAIHKGYYFRPGFLYKTHLLDIAIGGSVLLSQSDPGAEIMIQKVLNF